MGSVSNSDLYNMVCMGTDNNSNKIWHVGVFFTWGQLAIIKIHGWCCFVEKDRQHGMGFCVMIGTYNII